jgi:hypothetical protein
MRTRLILAGLLIPAALAVAASPARLSIIKKPKVPATPTPAPVMATPAPAAPAMADNADGLPAEHVKFFEDNIAPLLADKCYTCHSVAEGKSKGGLTMDTREALRKGGDSGPIIEPGNPDKSLFMTAIEYKDRDLEMPPASVGGKMNDAEIALFREWIKMGAPDPRKPGMVAASKKLSGLTGKARAHWAYQPLKRPEVPKPSNAAWSFTPIDNFIMAKLEEKKLVASPGLTDTAEGKQTLIRRAYFDLIGLPPTPAEIDAFIKDETPQAFAKIVERLLASPHYGERWARFWLDTARYSDTVGGDQNNNTQRDYRYPYAWTYRDWVINALNADMPYDQFITNQLAADLVPNNDTKNLAALGFVTVGERFQQVNDTINDRIDVVGKAFLGMSVSCARCHDHMFDPIPQKDYYALHGVFSSILEPDEEQLPVLSKPDPVKAKEFQTKLAAYEQEDREEFFRVQSEASREFREKAAVYLQAAYLSGRNMSEADQRMRDQLLTSNQLDGQFANFIRQRASSDTRLFGPLTNLWDMNDADLAALGARRAAEIAANANKAYNPIVAAKFKGFKPTRRSDLFALYGQIFAEFEPKAAAAYAAAKADSSQNGSKVNRDELELAASVFQPYTAGQLDTATMKEAIDRWPLRIRGRGRYNFSDINALTMTHDGAAAKAMAVKDSEPRDSRLLIRGQAGTPGEVVPRGFLEVLSPGGKAVTFSQGSGRLELAQCIVSNENPVVARVLVNRVWAYHFGEGFVRTLDDIGVKSEAPSHRELVDYLSHWFITDGKWSLKHLHRFIMNSKVYQIRSFAVKSNEEIDPDNRYLWRANVRRLDFEAMRDSMLAMSGRLDPEVGGQPVNLTDEPYSYRRTVYGYVDRGALPDLMSHFDFSDPHMPNSKRTSTIVPQQALFLMNSPFAIDVARRIIARPEVINVPDDIHRVIAIYKIIFSRVPKPHETQMAFKFLGDETYASRQLAAPTEKIIDQANRKLEEMKAGRTNRRNMRNERREAIKNEGEWVERKALTAWETYAQALLLSNEAVYVN